MNTILVSVPLRFTLSTYRAFAKRTLVTSLAIAVFLTGQQLAWAGDGPQGITEPTILPPFDEHAPRCSAPSGVQKILAFAQDNERQFMEGTSHGLALAAKQRGLDYRVMLAGNDAAKMVADIGTAVAHRVGAVIASPVDPYTLGPSLQRVIWSGGYVGTVVPPPATTILNAPQYMTGKVLANEAASYIRNKLGGVATVVLLTHDSLQFLAPRFEAMRDVLKELPGTVIVADISPPTVNKEGGFTTMQTILIAHPRIDVVLGADTVVLGALKALRAAGKERPEQFLGGIDGEPEAIAELKKGGAYKTSVALSSPVFGYALGQNAADWLEGKSVPQAMDILPIAMTKANVAQYEADLENPDAVYANPARRAAYLKMYGNICYDTRERYLNFPWSSERK